MTKVDIGYAIQAGAVENTATGESTMNKSSFPIKTASDMANDIAVNIKLNIPAIAASTMHR